MLVLSRKAGQRLFIGDDIVVTITEIVGNHKVKVGIEAPRSVAVMREELVQQQAASPGRKRLVRPHGCAKP